MIYKPLSIAIRKKEDCLYSYRNGIKGRIILGYSFSILIFGKEIIKRRFKKKEGGYLNE